MCCESAARAVACVQRAGGAAATLWLVCPDDRRWRCPASALWQLQCLLHCEALTTWFAFFFASRFLMPPISVQLSSRSAPSLRAGCSSLYSALRPSPPLVRQPLMICLCAAAGDARHEKGAGLNKRGRAAGARRLARFRLLRAQVASTDGPVSLPTVLADCVHWVTRCWSQKTLRSHTCTALRTAWRSRLRNLQYNTLVQDMSCHEFKYRSKVQKQKRGRAFMLCYPVYKCHETPGAAEWRGACRT